MSIYIEFYVDGFDQPARNDSVVSKAHEVLKDNPDMGLSLSLSDVPDALRYMHVDDGYCMIQSDVRLSIANPNNKIRENEQLAFLKTLFPNRNIILGNDALDRETFVERIKQHPERFGLVR